LIWLHYLNIYVCYKITVVFVGLVDQIDFNKNKVVFVILCSNAVVRSHVLIYLAQITC
jgi:mannitol/fructose-specific phosphotransferase system IIA component (Ntr-type)